MLRLRHFVPLAAIASLGCFESHEQETLTRCGPSDAVCCTPEGFTAPPLDDCPFSCPRGSVPTPYWLCGPSGVGDAGPTPRDAGAGAPDAGALCPPVRASVACFDGTTVPIGRAFSLPVTFDQCGCCPQAGCAVAVSSARRLVHVTTTLCPDVCDCDECLLPQVACEVPPLTAGDWTVEVNGAPAFRVRAAATLPDVGSTCVDFAEPDPACASGSEGVPGVPFAVESVCVHRAHERNAIDGWSIEVVDSCGGCDLEGPCEVRIEERMTDDLPPGYDLFVSPRRYFSSCTPACDPICVPTRRECLVPAPLAGDVHRVFVDGAPRLTFGAGMPSACTVSP